MEAIRETSPDNKEDFCEPSIDEESEKRHAMNATACKTPSKQAPLNFNFSFTSKKSNDLGDRKSSLKESEVRCSTLNTNSALNRDSIMNEGAKSPESAKSPDFLEPVKLNKDYGSCSDIRKQNSYNVKLKDPDNRFLSPGARTGTLLETINEEGIDNHKFRGKTTHTVQLNDEYNDDYLSNGSFRVAGDRSSYSILARKITEVKFVDRYKVHRFRQTLRIKKDSEFCRTENDFGECGCLACWVKPKDETLKE